METCNVVLTFESVDEILWCDHSNDTSLKGQYHEVPRAALFTVLAPEFRTYHC